MGKRQATQSSLAKLVMNHNVATSSPSRSPPASTSPTLSDPEQPPAVQAQYSHTHKRDVSFAQPPVPAMLSAMRGIKDLTDTPTFPLSVNSTAPSSPRL